MRSALFANFNRAKLLFIVVLTVVALVSGCASSPPEPAEDRAVGKAVCDTYIILSMCVEDIDLDGTVDMVYFTDTLEAFMYQDGKKSEVEQVMPFHRCAVPLNEGMQTTTNRILNRANLTFSQELDITRKLLASYRAAKPEIDACNARYEDTEPAQESSPDEFSDFEPDWDDEF
ncbi:MAG: hypothetical protein AB8C02_19320 [Halioglobus sp.]